MTILEWDARFTRDTASGEVTCALYEVEEAGQLRMLDLELFGPFDTAMEVVAWLTRHWAPRAKLPMR